MQHPGPTFRPAALTLLLAAALLGGCRWPWGQRSSSTSASAGRTDPLLMSHLTHHKNDPQFAETEGGAGEEEPTVRPASNSRSKKPPGPGGFSGGPLRGRDADYRWVRGTLTFRRRGAGHWYVEYGRGAVTDRFGDRLRLDGGARAGLFREGDRVHLEGRLEERPEAEPIYVVESLSLLEQ